jgi:hypothetical protein
MATSSKTSSKPLPNSSSSLEDWIQIEPHNEEDNELLFIESNFSYVPMLNVGIGVSDTEVTIVCFDKQIIRISNKVFGEMKFRAGRIFPDLEHVIVETAKLAYIVNITSRKIVPIYIGDKPMLYTMVCLPRKSPNSTKCYISNAWQKEEGDDAVFELQDGKFTHVGSSKDNTDFIPVFTQHNNSFSLGEEPKATFYINPDNREDYRLEMGPRGFFLTLDGKTQQIDLDERAVQVAVRSEHPSSVYLSKSQQTLYFFGDALFSSWIS